MKTIIKKLITHWKTSFAALIIGLLTIMLYFEKIDVNEWVMATGALGTVIGFLAKDWDKTDQA